MKKKRIISVTLDNDLVQAIDQSRDYFKAKLGISSRSAILNIAVRNFLGQHGVILKRTSAEMGKEVWTIPSTPTPKSIEKPTSFWGKEGVD